MSVNAKIYLGVYLDISRKVDIYDEKFFSFTEERKNEKFSIINDGMCGQYCYFGITIATIVDIYDDNSINKKIIKFESVSQYIQEVEEKLRELGIEIHEKPELIFFSHCY